MINPFADVNWRPDRVGLQGFARSLMIGFPVLAVVWVVIGRLSTGAWSFGPAAWLAAAGAGAGLLFHALPAVARPFYVAQAEEVVHAVLVLDGGASMQSTDL